MLGDRLRRYTNIKTTLDQYIVLLVVIIKQPSYLKKKHDTLKQR